MINVQITWKTSKKKKKKHIDPSAPFLLPDQGSPKTAYTTHFFHNNRPKALLTGNSFKMVTVDGATQWFVLKSSSFFTKKKPESPHQCKIQSAFSAKSSKQEINTHYGHWYRPVCQAYFLLIDNKLC